MTKTIVVVGGYWSTNIGNSFFQLGAEYLLRRAFPQARVVMIADQPGYYNVKQGNPPNAFIAAENIPADYLAVLGPFLRPEYETIWEATMENLLTRGIRILVLGAGMMDYSSEMVRKSRRWLSKIRPFILTTRDEDTYNNFADLAEHSFNSIDLAFFVSDFYDPVPPEIEDYVVFNFDKIPEPCIDVSEQEDAVSNAEYTFKFRDKTWKLKFPYGRTLLCRKSRLFSFIEPQLARRHSYLLEVDGLRVVRTDHRFNPLLLGKAYKGPESFVSDVPWPYLDIYSQASCVFSNRVHACVAALAYERPAMLFSNTPRARLLQRAGADDIIRKPCTIPSEQLAREKRALLSFLQQMPL